MQRIQSIGLVVLLFIAGCASTDQAGANPGARDAAAVQAATAQFYRAINQMFVGDIELMTRVWSHADDVTYMGPAGGMQVGWKAVHEQWRKQADMKLGGSLTTRDMQMTVGRDLAVVINYEIGKNVGGEGAAGEVSLRATNVFRKESGRWKMIGHYTDPLAILQN